MKDLQTFSPWRWAHQAALALSTVQIGAGPAASWRELRDDMDAAAFDHLDPSGTAPSVCADAVRCFTRGS